MFVADIGKCGLRSESWSDMPLTWRFTEFQTLPVSLASIGAS
jgi:hypothetical protein